jgi:hypothetical protein
MPNVIPPSPVPSPHIHKHGPILFFTGLLALIIIAAAAYYLYVHGVLTPAIAASTL